MRIASHRELIAVTIVIASFFLYATKVVASQAILMGSTVCQDQADVFDYKWLNENKDDTRLFFIRGSNAHNGAINSVGHTDPFNASDDVYVIIHGNVNSVGPFNGADFADVFLASHATAPANVTMYVCESSSLPPAGASTMGKLANKYPRVDPPYSLTRMEVPEPDSCPRLRGRVTAVSAPITQLRNAVYRSDVLNTPASDAILARLMSGWNGSSGLTYPGSAMSYEDYCNNRLAADPTGQWLPGFIANVNAQFRADYLGLINTNYGGNLFNTCGRGTARRCQ